MCMPVYPFLKWGIMGYTFHGHVFLILKYFFFGIITNMKLIKCMLLGKCGGVVVEY